MALRVLVIDDHPMFREAIADLAQHVKSDAEVWQATSGEDGLRLARENGEPDLVLLDLALPGMDGVATAAAFSAACPTVPVVVVTGEESDARCAAALRAGAVGVVPKTLPAREIIRALEDILAGGSYVPERLRTYLAPGQPPESVEREPGDDLTARQIEVLALMARGWSNKQIAQKLDLTDKTVKSHLTRIFKVLGAVNRTQAVLAAQKRGLV